MSFQEECDKLQAEIDAMASYDRRRADLVLLLNGMKIGYELARLEAMRQAA